ncbi:tyrosine-protein phosphatase non-receptor type 13 [Rhincodon typus]|uniref:tyrosine-protein phosphatase non-receptor type 13 n=1 Tax=Rhincodon typus TaxID=259920 RepID=UPI00202EA26E|nr:tyrosine-protein phosphatase non-receptor type 13 [Rhincodon typus]
MDVTTLTPVERNEFLPRRSGCKRRTTVYYTPAISEAKLEVPDLEPVSKFSGSLFDTEEGFQRNRHMRAFLHGNQRQLNIPGSSDTSKQQVCKLANNTGGDVKCPERSNCQPTLLISTGFKETLAKKLNITVHSPMGSLGISIAGGKGSTPYKISDDRIFISKVSKGGPADLAGVQVGDLVLEVNGISLQNVTHHEAVNALRNSGAVIKIIILRDRDVTSDATVTSDSNNGEIDIIKPHQTEQSCFITQPSAIHQQLKIGNFFLEGKAVSTCNANSLESESVTLKNHTTKSASEMPLNNTSFCIVNHAMPADEATRQEVQNQGSIMSILS